MEVEGMDEETQREYNEVEEGDHMFMTTFPEEAEGEWIVSAHTYLQKVAIEAWKEKVKKSLGEMVLAQHLEEFWEVVEKGQFDRLPEWWQWDHAIELKPGGEPFATQIYPLNLDEQKHLDEFLEENLKFGKIRPSKSPIASPFFFIKKKDGSLRPVQDYCKLMQWHWKIIIHSP